MEWTVGFDELDVAAVVRTRGKFSIEDHARMVADIVARKEWRPDSPILFDHRALDFEGVGYEEMRKARDTHVAQESRIGRARSAILMKSGTDYGIGRQFQMLADDSTSADIQIFDDETAAQKWVRASPVPR